MTTSDAERVVPGTGAARTTIPVCTLTLAALTVAAFAIAPAPDVLSAEPFWLGVLDRDRPADLWRTITAHLLHTDLNHLLWNLVALIALAWVIERRSSLLLALSVGTGMAAVGLWFFSLAQVSYYCGLSGVLNTLLVVLLYTLYVPGDRRGLAEQSRKVHNGILVLVALGALSKNIYELTTGAPLVSSTSWDSAPGAHLAGWAGGLGVALATYFRSRRASAPDLVLETSDPSRC